MARQMPQDGVLYLGGAETVLGITDAFAAQAGERGVYERSSSGPAPARPAPTIPTMATLGARG